MRQAFFIAGFNNWGKTTIIEDLFNSRRQYRQGWTYRITGVNFNNEFTVETHSNDDYTGQSWVDHVQERIDNSPDNGENLFTALCPSMESHNNFLTLLSQPTFSTYDRLHIFLIEYKWEHHARLIINNIVNTGRNIPNVNFIVINADQNLTTETQRRGAKVSQIRQELNRIFGTP